MIYNDVSPIAFTIGSVSVAWYGIMVALAVLTLVVWALWAVKKGARVSYDTVVSAAIVGIPSGVIFSRVLHVIDFWDYFMEHPGQIIGGSGLSIYGAVLGAALGVWIYSRFRRMSFGYFADMLAPGIILAQAIGRVGCTLNGCCFGTETDIFCAMIYTNPDSLGPLGIPVHPTQVYEIIYNLILFGVLLSLRNRFRPDGSLFLIYLTLYSVWRLGIDFIRDGTFFIGNFHSSWPSGVDFIQNHLPWLYKLHEAQWIAIVVLIITITLMGMRTRWVKKGELDS
ncbi:MAG: prolipoprotein diacylglyceryl transferase [Dehalococcoidales bacterium]|nr:prolipoprotein diacylglyceryl transferase [Dehalococcoidales bacterium]